MKVREYGLKARNASRILAKAGTDDKNRALKAASRALIDCKERILEANKKDLINAREKQMPAPMVDRLKLDDSRIEAMAHGIEQVEGLDDPTGEITGMKRRPNGLLIGQMRVPLGVVAIIYESRPNVTADAFALTFKTGNAVILRGGSDSINSNLAIGEILRSAVKESGMPEDSIQVIADTSHESAEELMTLNGLVDVLIPRGGRGLIKRCVEHATVPVIETGTGNCHVYVDESADLDMAVRILMNAKTQRYGVCNACESLLVHEAVHEAFLKAVFPELEKKNVELRGDRESMEVIPDIVPATKDDWGREYLDAILSVKVVQNIDEAIDHINRYNTGHSETIVTENYDNAMRFLKEVDAACVYVNASTRFTDGYEFGFGAEIGISTQKLHARGPMGLTALTTTKYIICGNGQIRE